MLGLVLNSFTAFLQPLDQDFAPGLQIKLNQYKKDLQQKKKAIAATNQEMCNWRKPILCLLLFLSSSHLTSSFWAFEQHLQKLCTFYIWELEQYPAELFKRLLCSEFAARTLLSSQICCENFSLVNLLWGTSLFWICLRELLLSSGFACENFFSLLDSAVRTSSLSGFCFKNCFSFGEASTNITYLSSAKSFLSKHVCMLHTSSLQASSFKSSRPFGSDDIPDNFASSSSSLHQKLSRSPLLSRFRSKQNNKTPTQSPVATNNVHGTWTRRSLSLSLSLSLSSRVPLPLFLSLSDRKRIDRRSCTRRRRGVRWQEKRVSFNSLLSDRRKRWSQKKLYKKTSRSPSTGETRFPPTYSQQPLLLWERESFVLAFPLWRKQKSQ